MVSPRAALLVIAIFNVAAAVAQGQNPSAKCAGLNEYCQNHWDCCSNSCLSYLYRCVRNHQVVPNPLLGDHYLAEGTLEDILASVFGSRNKVGGNAPNATLQTSDASKRHRTPQLQETTQAAQQPQIAINPKPILVGLNSRFGGDEVSTTVMGEPGSTKTTGADAVAEETTTPPGEKTTSGVCKQLSARCFSNEECCSKRCDKYFKECVPATATTTLRA